MNDHGVKHLALIMDGNRRWAKEQGLPSFEGHRKGAETLKRLGEWALAKNIKVVTVFAFSTENWKRAQDEVGYLMDLIEVFLSKELAWFKEHNVRLRILGRREGLRPSILRAIDRAEAETAALDRATFCICLNYGGRAEIVDACRQIIKAGTPEDQITEELITKQLYGGDLPDPDLIIRTSGEKRLSGFLLWQSAYSELYWCEKHWPAFEEADLDAALEDFAARQRRYGK